MNQIKILKLDEKEGERGDVLCAVLLVQYFPFISSWCFSSLRTLLLLLLPVLLSLCVAVAVVVAAAVTVPNFLF